jgi:hypothetical protein
MNKFVSPVSCLAALGSLLSGLLVFLHYYPDLGESYLCNGTFLGNCNPVNKSTYSTLRISHCILRALFLPGHLVDYAHC